MTTTTTTTTTAVAKHFVRTDEWEIAPAVPIKGDAIDNTTIACDAVARRTYRDEEDGSLVDAWEFKGWALKANGERAKNKGYWTLTFIKERVPEVLAMVGIDDPNLDRGEV